MKIVIAVVLSKQRDHGGKTSENRASNSRLLLSNVMVCNNESVHQSISVTISIFSAGLSPCQHNDCLTIGEAVGPRRGMPKTKTGILFFSDSQASVRISDFLSFSVVISKL